MELIVAMAISALILVSMATITSGVLNTRQSLLTADADMQLANRLELLISKDIRMMSGTTVSNDNVSRERTYLFTVKTYNSLTFNRAIPVNVSYFIKDEVLYREEFRTDMNYKMLLPLLEKVTNPKVETFDGSVYKNDLNSLGYIYRITLRINNRYISFISGRMQEAIF